MTKLSQLEEDRALRNAAHNVFQTDLSFVRSDLTLGHMGRKLAARVSESAAETAEEAVEIVKRHPRRSAAAAAAVGIAAIAWLARKPIVSLFGKKPKSGVEPESSEDR